MKRRPAQGPRGQAIVELALGALVFVTILLFGIYFAEAGFLGLKIQESATHALWDVTGRKLHDYRTMDNTVLRDQAIGTSENQAETQYRGYKGYGAGGSAGITLVTAKAAPVKVHCEADPNAEDWGDVDTTAIPGDQRIYSAGGLVANSGVRCNAIGEVQVWNIPTSFAEGSNGFFKAKHWSDTGRAASGKIKLCGFGRMGLGAACPASVAILVDDWGLQGTEEARPCMLDPSPTACGNEGYKKLVGQVWTPSFPGLDPTVTFAVAFAGIAPIDPNLFWFSYSPQPTNWVDQNYPAGEGPDDWHTGTGANNRHAGYATAYGDRKDFWLGKPQNWVPARP